MQHFKLDKLDSMSLEELQGLKKAVAKAIETVDERRRREAIASIEAKAREMGYSLSELTGVQGRSRRTPRPVRFRHPDKPELTWSGIGRHPSWIKEAIENGASLDDFRVNG